MLVDRGLLDYDDPVAKFWPEFARKGKEHVTVRHLLCHQAGLYRIRDLIDDASRMLDWAYMTDALARSAPAIPPGSASAYHGLTYGWLVGEVVQRVSGRPVRDVVAEEIAPARPRRPLRRLPAGAGGARRGVAGGGNGRPANGGAGRAHPPSSGGASARRLPIDLRRRHALKPLLHREASKGMCPR